MLVGYVRVSTADGSQSLDLQTDALTAAGVTASSVYSDLASGKADARPGLDACLEALGSGDTLVVRKLDHLGRNLRHLVHTIHDLIQRAVDLKVLTGQGAATDTTTPAGQLVFTIFAALAEHERSLISERTIAGLTTAKARGRTGGRRYTMIPVTIRLAAAAMADRDTSTTALCTELGIGRQTLYRCISPTGQLRPDAHALLARAEAGR